MKNIIKIALFSCFSLCASATVGMVTAKAETQEKSAVVYVSANGNDQNAGTQDAPYQTFSKALENVKENGTVNVIGTVKDGVKTVDLTEDVTFENVTLTFEKDAWLFANGHKLVVEETVTMPNAITVYGGSWWGLPVDSTNVTLLGGQYNRIYGGTFGGTVNGDTYLRVGGNVNSTINAMDHNGEMYIFGGNKDGKILGSTNFTFEGNAKANYVYGGSENNGVTIGQGSTLTLTGGSAMSVYGGSWGADSGSGANVTITGGTFEQVFGGNYNQSMTGDVDVRVLGGTIGRRIYAGCYNDTQGLFSITFKSNYCVSGDVCLTLGGNANITYGYSSADKGVYARSRYNQDMEKSQLIFADETAYNNYTNGNLKLSAQDSTMKEIMGNLSVADELHYYTYTKQDKLITQTCAYHNTLQAKATLALDTTACLYSGEEIEPITVEVSNDWEYDVPTISYRNNVEIGEAQYSVEVGESVFEDTFYVVGVPTILGGSVRLSAPAGLRFQSKVSEKDLLLDATFGTLMIPKEILGDVELTIDTDEVRNVEQTLWATENVKLNNPQQYEDGYEYFNAVLTKIPVDHYGTDIVARSYVCVDGVYYYSETIERSLAQVSAYALQDGYTDEVLYTYVDMALKNEALQISLTSTASVGKESVLELTGNKGYVAIWTVSDESVASIDKNGKLIGKSVGEVVVTAKIGNKTAQITVSVLPVEMSWGDWNDFNPDRENTLV